MDSLLFVLGIARRAARGASRGARWLACAAGLAVCLGGAFRAQAAPSVNFGTNALADITDKQITRPLSNIVVAGSGTLTARIDFTPTASGELLANTNLVTRLGAGSYSVPGGTNAAGLQSLLRSIDFDPTENRIPITTVSETTTFTVIVSDGTDAATNSVNLGVRPVNDSPTIGFPNPQPQDIDDKTTTRRPFQSITVTDVDANDLVTVQFSLSPAAAGGFATSSDLTFSAGVYTLSQRTPTSAQDFLRALTFTPVENRIPLNSSENVTFSVTARDRANAPGTNSVGFAVTPVNDPPSISGSLGLVTDNARSTPFASLVISDPDVVSQGPPVVTESVNLRIVLAETEVAGTLDGGLLVTNLSGTGSALTALLDNLGFNPVANQLPVGQERGVAFQLEASDGSVSTTNQMTLLVQSTNDPPTASFALTQETVADTSFIRPLKLTVDDPDLDEVFRFRIHPISDPTFFYGQFEPALEFTGPKSTLELEVDNIIYRPIPDRAATNQAVSFRVSVSDQHGPGGAVTSAVFVITIQAVNTQPEIAGTPSTILRTTDDPNAAPLRPFTEVRITDADVGQILTVTLSVSDPSLGSFSQTVLTGTAEEVTRDIRAVEFSATRKPDRTLGQSETARLTITVNDGAGGIREDNRTRVTIMAVNGAPVISGIPDEQPLRLDPEPPIRPFEHVSISDDDAAAIVVIVEADNPAKGAFALPLPAPDVFVENPVDSGRYAITNMPSVVTTALQAMQWEADTDFVFPPDRPGGVKFTITARDSVLNTSTRSLDVIIAEPPRNWLVTHSEDDFTEGSLRFALQQIEAEKANSAHITFALPGYPATLALQASNGPIVLNRNISLKGPGADLLTISGDSNGDGVPDLQLIQVGATVVIEGITLSHGGAVSGSALSGGAISVGATGRLTLREVAIRNSVAAQWGGGVDVDGGKLVMERCLVAGNSTDSVLGRGGGGISIFTDQECLIVNTTFSGNRQGAATGIGGGAIYIENASPPGALPVLIAHATFAENSDASPNGGTSIHANVFGAAVTVRNSVLADRSFRNLRVEGAASILSGGGNVSDDQTRVTLTQNGTPKEVLLLNAGGDIREVVAPLVLPLDEGVRPTPAYHLAAGSPAIGRAVSPAAATDQRGVIRSAPDSGALELNATARIVINEIQFSEEAGVAQFVEIYVPRNSEAVDFANYSLWVNGEQRFEFSDLSETRVRPGRGIVVADGAITPAGSTPLGLVDPGALGLEVTSVVEVRAGSGVDRVLERAEYVAAFVDPFEMDNEDKFEGNSITLAPQFLGFAFLPHSIVRSDPPEPSQIPGADLDALPDSDLDSPGADAGDTPFGSPNAFPTAVADHHIVDEDWVSDLAVRANDFDADGGDHLAIVDLDLATPATGEDSTLTTPKLAQASVLPGGSPLRGDFIRYDPTVSSTLQALPLGGEATDVFHYAVVDIRVGAIEAYSDNGGDDVAVLSPNHRLEDGAEIEISGSGIGAYNGVFTITRLDEDSFQFTPPSGFAGNPTELGGWRATAPWAGQTAASTASITVTVLGANDPPAPGPDFIGSSEASEDIVLRIMAGPTENAGAVNFDTDVLYPFPPIKSVVRLLANDDDPDSDDTAASLRVVGVVGTVKTNISYSGTIGVAPVTVASPGHGLSSGNRILISGYGGHPSYNDFHEVTVLDDGHYTIPVLYVDDHAEKGIWAELNDANRDFAITELGAEARLEIRVDPLETSVVYNARVSEFLNGLSAGVVAQDSFYYAVEDSHGAVSLARVTLDVRGVNDLPEPMADPSSLEGLALIAGGTTPDALTNLLASLQINFALPAMSDTPGRADVELLTTDQPPSRFLLSDVFATDEETSLSISADDLLANDGDVDRMDTLSILSVDATSALGAAVVLGAGGASVEYNPADSSALQMLSRGETRLDTFEIRVWDGTDAVSSLVVVLVTGVNDTPEAHPDIATTDEDTPATLNPILTTAADFDLDRDGTDPDDVLSMVPESKITARGAAVTIMPDAFTYDPRVSAELNALAVGQSAIDTVEYTAMDGSFVFAVNDRFQVAADGEGYVLEVLANDRNLTGVGFPISGYSGVPGEAPVTVVAPAHGLASGAVVVIAGYGGESYNRSHRVTVVDENTFTIPVAFVANDPVKGHWSEFRIVEISPGNAGGVAEIGSNGTTIVYSPEVNYVGDEVFAYTVIDSFGNTDRGLVSVRSVVDSRNGILQANPDAFSVAKGMTPLLDVLANDHVLPAGGAGLVIERIVTPPSRGAAEIDANRIIYRQDGSGPFPYTVEFSYEISGGGVSRATATVTVQVVDREDTEASRLNLLVRDDVFGVVLDSRNNPLTVLLNDGFLPGASEELFIREILTPPAAGTATVDAAAKTILYTPPAGFIGEETLTYVAEDRLGGLGVGVVRMRVGNLTTRPDFLSAPYDDPDNDLDDELETTLDVLANDQTVPGGGATLVLVDVTPTVSAIGTIRVGDDGRTLAFNPDEGAEGEAEFTYTIGDGSGRTAQGRVTVLVRREGVWANSDSFAVAVDSSDNALPVTDNDTSFPDLGRTLVVVGVGTGQDAPDHGGTVVIGADGRSVLYTPAPGFQGVETFTYIVSDSRRTDIARVAVRVGAGELSASDDAFTVFFGPPAPGQPKATFLLPVLNNDRVLPDFGQALIITGVGINDDNADNAPTENGIVRISSDRLALVYEPNSDTTDFPYTETFTYEISDGTARRAQARVTLEVFERGGDRDVVIHDDAYSVARDSVGNRLRVLMNDHIKPASAAGWTLSNLTEPSNGGIAEIVSGEILYTPAPGFVGVETFAYTASDGLGGTGEATVTVRVGNLYLTADNFVALSGSSASDNVLDLLANDGIREGVANEDYHLVDARVPAGSDATLFVAHGAAHFAPSATYSGPYPYIQEFEYDVADDSNEIFTRTGWIQIHEAGSDRDTATVQWTIIGVNDAPTLENAGPSTITLTDKEVASPFAGVTIGEVDDGGNEPVHVRVVLDDPAAGRLSSPGGAFAEETFGNGAYVFNGTAAEATAAIRALVFTPTENYVTVPETWAFHFDILVTDPHVTVPTAGSVVVQVQAVNDAPIISGTVAGQPVNYLGSIRLFASATITEIDDLTEQPLVVTVSFNVTRGNLSNLGGFVQQSPGVFVFEGPAAAATAALRGLVFSPTTGNRLSVDRNPPPSSEETVFTLTVDDGFADPVADSTTSVIAYHSLITEAGASGGSSPDDVGYSVGAGHDIVVMGAPGENSSGSDAGAVYVRARNQGGTGAWGQAARLLATDPTSNARLGAAVAVDGATIVAGAPNARRGNGGTPTSGAAYVYEPSSPGGTDWQANAFKLAPGDGANSDSFGSAVAISGSFIAVGSPGDDDAGSNSGSVYIFQRQGLGNWTQVAKIVGTGLTSGDAFGSAVALSGNELLVGAPLSNPSGNDSGSAYIFARNGGGTWTEIKRILAVTATGANDGAASDFFGSSVALDDGHALIGSPGDNLNGNDYGSAFIFRRGQGGANNWGFVAKLNGTDLNNGDQFGYSVALSDGIALIGMPFDGHSNQSRVGSAFAFHRHAGGTDNWGLVERLRAPDASNNDQFAYSVAIHCGLAAVGAVDDAFLLSGAGSAYIYDLAYVKPPHVATPIPDQIAVVGVEFNFVIPEETFGDADPYDVLTLSVPASGPGSLPAGWTFDPVTRTITGTPAATGTLAITIIATDNCDHSVSTTLTIGVFATPPPTLPLPGEALSYDEWIERLMDPRILGTAALEGTVWGRGANSDGDAFTNFEEYAFATRLFESTEGDGPRLSISVASDGRIAVTHRERVNDPSLTFTLEYSADMLSWTPVTSPPAQHVRARLWHGLDVVTSLLPPDALPASVFFRVRIDEEP